MLPLCTAPFIDEDKKNALKAAKDEVKELEKKLAVMQVELMNKDKTTELAVKNAELETRMQMQKAVEAAYDKGYARCREGLEMLKNLRM